MYAVFKKSVSHPQKHTSCSLRRQISHCCLGKCCPFLWESH